MSNQAGANPTAPVVVNGAASFTQTGNLLSITNSPNAIINWGSFSIGANEITRFIQQNGASSVLNRVGPGGNPSVILGQLQSLLTNGAVGGRVFLINPNGITFGAGSQINVGGLIASTLNLSNEDFLAGRMRFTDGLNKSLINDGTINTTQGGNVYLIGSALTNNGLITSPKGDVILAAGNRVELVNPGTPDLRVEIAAPDNQAINLGQITAEAGRIGIYAGLINHAGTINADSVSVDAAGRITLKATKNIDLAHGGVISADGPHGGDIVVQSGELTRVAGKVSAVGDSGKGGTVHLLGDRVGLDKNADVNASGASGGGTVLIGGDYLGRNPLIQNAKQTYIDADAVVKADALTNGNGGKIIAWSDDATFAYGSLSARGGAQWGNGGFIETSGGYLDINGIRVDAIAPRGRGGIWLLDPHDIIIQAAGPNTGINTNFFAGSVLYTSLADSAVLTTGTINAQLNGGVTVIVQTATATATTQTGNITVNDPITKTGGATAGLILNADNNLNINADITSTTGQLNITFDAGLTTPSGAVNLGNVNINTNGGTITATAETVNIGGATSINAAGFNAGTLNVAAAGLLTLNTPTTALDLTNAGTITGSGGISVSNNFTWSGGLISGTGFLSTFGTGGTDVTGPVTLQRNWTASSGVNVTGAGSINIGAGSTLSIPVGQTFFTNSAGGTVVSGGGTLAVTAGNVDVNSAGTVAILPASFTTAMDSSGGASHIDVIAGTLQLGAGSDNGTLYVGAGALDFVSGARTMTGGSLGTTGGAVTFSGANVTFSPTTTYNPSGLTNISGGVVTFNGPTTIFNGLNLSGGTLTGAGNLDFVSPATTWSGGTISGTGTLTSGDVAITGTANLQRNWTTNGIVTISGAGNLAIGAGSAFTNSAAETVVLAGTNATPISGTGTFNNLGLLHKTSGGASMIVTPTFNNSGSVDVSAGTLQVVTSGTESANYNVAAGAALEFGGGARVFTGGGIVNAGTLSFVGGNITLPTLNAGGITNLNAGSLTVNGATTVNPGATMMLNGGTFNAAGPINNQGIIQVASLLNAPGQTLTIGTTGELLLNGGTVAADVANGGILKGVGTINGGVTNAGTLEPGASPGIMNITGNYVQTPTGVLLIEIGGTTPGSGYDQLAIGGTATLDGTMQVQQFGGFVPTAPATFQVLTAGDGVNGTFASVTTPVALSLSTVYSGFAVDLSGGASGGASAAASSAVDAIIAATEKKVFVSGGGGGETSSEKTALTCD